MDTRYYGYEFRKKDTMQDFYLFSYSRSIE